MKSQKNNKDSTQEIKKSRDFSISFHERRLILIILDLIVINSGFILSLVIRPDYIFSVSLILDHPDWFILLNGLWFFVGYLFQVYDLERAGKPNTAFPNVLGAGLISQIIYNAIPYLTPVLPPSRQPLFLVILIPTATLLIGRIFYLVVIAQPQFRRRMIIVGAGWAGKTIFYTVKEHGKSLYQLVGFIDDDPEKLGSSVEVAEEYDPELLTHPTALTVIGRSKDLLKIIEQYHVTTIVMAITQDVSGELYQYLADCLQYGVEIIPMPVLYEQLTGKVPVEHIGDNWAVSMPLEHPGTSVIWHATKRIFDVIWSLIGLVFLGLLFPWIALSIFLDSPGPILYSQIRLGRNGKPYLLYKFRSMVADAEQGQAVWAEKNDPRMTRIGRFLRRTHLDEFPQFVNILKGDMSVVGPRPERPEFVEKLAEQIPFYRVRLAVKPGMAGWGLIHKGYGASEDAALEKLQYDLYYIKHQSLWLDLYILGRTFIDAITFGGR